MHGVIWKLTFADCIYARFWQAQAGLCVRVSFIPKAYFLVYDIYFRYAQAHLNVWSEIYQRRVLQKVRTPDTK